MTNPCKYRNTGVYCVSIFLAATLGMKTAKKEGNDIGSQQRLLLLEELFSKKGEEVPPVSMDDLLSPEDKQNPVNPTNAKEKVKSGVIHGENEDLKSFLKTATRKEKLEGDEPLFSEAKIRLPHPERAIDVASEQTELIPEEIELETCQEKGCYQASIQQKLTVNVTPEVKRETKICLGHAKEKAYFWKKDAEQAKEKKKSEFKKDASIKEYHVHVLQGGIFKKYGIKSSWKHLDNTSCDHYRIEETLVQKAQEEDQWKTDSPKLLKSLEADPDCSLLYTQIISGPQTKVINGHSVFRETWERALFFSCGGSEGSKCRRLRDLGGVLIGKKCLKETSLGDCLLWEKTYDLGRLAAHQNTALTFENTDLWGLSESEDSSYEKNRDLPAVAATIAVFAEIKKMKENRDQDSLLKSAQIFKGGTFKCQRSFVKGILYDCCKKMDGLAVHAKLAQCTSEEKCLSQKRNEGKCRFIGSKQSKLGTETTHIYCCFPTKLSRVIHEQGRKQLGIAWGKADKPQCRGLTLQELQRIDFSQIDFSEILDDLAIDQEDLKRKITNQVQQIQSSDQSHRIKTRTQTAVRPLEEIKESND